MKQRQRQQVLETTPRPGSVQGRSSSAKKSHGDTATTSMMQAEHLQPPTQMFYTQNGELIEFKQENNPPTIYIQVK